MTTAQAAFGGGAGRGLNGTRPGSALGTAMENEDEGLVITTEQRGVVAVIHLKGEVDLHTCGDLRTTLQRLTESAQTKIVVDMSAVPYIDSAGLGVLVDAQRRARETSGELCLAGAAPFVVRALEITRLIRIFRTADTVDDAVKSF